MGDWGDLNERQQTYLRAIYDNDQDAEALERSKWTHGGKPRSAAEWRWLFYGIFPQSGTDSPLRARLKGEHLVDEGTGSTFDALESRGLILCRHRLDTWLDVQITKAGRKMVRAATGENREYVKPGTLRDWQWAALAQAYAAGEKGIELGFGGDVIVSWETWRRLRDHKDGALVEEQMHAVTGHMTQYGYYSMNSPTESIVITAFGKWYYAANYDRYRALYPDVKARKPRTQHPKPEEPQERPMPKRIMVKATIIGEVVSLMTGQPLGDNDPQFYRTVSFLEHRYHLGVAVTADIEFHHTIEIAVADTVDLARWLVTAINASLDASPAAPAVSPRPSGTLSAPWYNGQVANISHKSHHYNRLGREVKRDGVSHTHFVLVTVLHAHWQHPNQSEERGSLVAQLPSEDEAHALAERLSTLLAPCRDSI